MAALLLREALGNDIPAIIEIEYTQEFREFLGRWTSEGHAAVTLDPETIPKLSDEELHLLLLNQDE